MQHLQIARDSIPVAYEHSSIFIIVIFVGVMYVSVMLEIWTGQSVSVPRAANSALKTRSHVSRIGKVYTWNTLHVVRHPQLLRPHAETDAFPASTSASTSTALKCDASLVCVLLNLRRPYPTSLAPRRDGFRYRCRCFRASQYVSSWKARALSFARTSD